MSSLGERRLLTRQHVFPITGATFLCRMLMLRFPMKPRRRHVLMRAVLARLPLYVPVSYNAKWR